MPPLNKGISPYHTIHGLYWRDSEGSLLAVEGSHAIIIADIWSHLKIMILSHNSLWEHASLPSGKQLNALCIHAAIPELECIRSKWPAQYQEEELRTNLAEVQHSDGTTLGMLISRPKSLWDEAFRTWTENFILLETQFRPYAQLSESSRMEHRTITEQVANLFERRLKNDSKNDQWHVCGREQFMNRVYGFVERKQPILLCLPAFPCKSSNSNKVGGTMPDLAEHIALDVLRSFVKDICTIYEPGATLWIISDGHVFSDCIGVDDETVDAYDAALIKEYQKKYSADEGVLPAIQFKGLKDIFMSNPDSFSSFKPSWVASAQVPHPVKTKLSEASELCRKLLLGVSQADRGFIRRCIEEQEPHALQLYRGQTRFMLEDLAGLSSVKQLSNKQKKKTAAHVAQEMISRNQAYSNLVELLLPNYVRLSIHAHDNSGPKFAVRLLPKKLVRPIQSLDHRHEPVPAYEFQIPTPWHNAIIQVEGDDMMYLVRAEVAKNAIHGDKFKGSWVSGPNGSYFSLKRSAPIAQVIDEEKLSLKLISTVPDVEAQIRTKAERRTWRLLLPVPSVFTLTAFLRRIWQNIMMRA
ncbi:hypothetical protein P154DRAFT_464448 [Amniculicola lignicola CBS 123094]|uniref:Pyoverdine/dityrosine biosynthesis protein n=1 Tax=Amniculicola lignicola CBS 123094 TaxID=1392246 RepID=A0A6A5WV40_9PLEO|nr:hypothetical protein P154DRAFT_464448 [Amniculicola lignicola CBS 123094]